ESGEVEFHILENTAYSVSASFSNKNASARASITGDKVETLRILNYNYSLAVRATDNARRPIEGVKVSAVAARGVGAYAGVTNDEGVVEFRDMSSNEFKLTVEYEKLVQKRSVKFLSDYNEEVFVFNIMVPPVDGNITPPYNYSNYSNGNASDGGGKLDVISVIVFALGALGYLVLVVAVSALIVLALILIRRGALLYTLARVWEYVKLKIQRK
ncbi:MAG: hypothetical protein AB1468_01705, partial [Candidatus Micrarchaeota archaeon]